MIFDKKRFLAMLAAGRCSKARKGQELPTIYMAAGLRKNADEYLWETLFDGEVTGEKIQYNVTLPDKICLDFDFDYCRITVDGETIEGVLPLGNKSLYSSSGEDTGESFYFRVSLGKCYLYTRTAGAHTVKIKRRIPKGYFSYNGINLPPLPEWNKEKYPVAYIYLNTLTGNYVLGVCDSYIYEHDDEGDYRVGAYKYRTTTGNNGAWGEPPDNYDNGTIWLTDVGTDFIIWTNTDILYENGTVATKATEPKPVYE